jgi:hypothetical protein
MFGLELLGGVSGLLGGGAGGAVPGMTPPAGDADASAAAGFGMVAPTLNQSFGAGSFYAKTSPVMDTDATIKGGTAATGAGTPGSGQVQSLTESGGGLPYPLLILGAVALVAILWGGRK